MAEDFVEIGSTGPKWKTDKIINRPERLKQIRVVRDENGASEPFVEKVANHPISVGYLEREFHFLTLLRDTGVTPYPQMYKKGEDVNTGRLMIEYVQGMSFEERMEKEDNLPSNTLPEVIGTALDGVDVVHSRGVVFWDLNKGSFMVTNDGKSVKIVDLEMAREEKELSNPDLQRSLHVSLEKNDIGIKLARFNFDHHFDAGTVMASERHEAAKTILNYYFRDPNDPESNQFLTFDFSRLSQDDMDVLQERKKMIQPQIDEIIDDEFSHAEVEEKEQARAEMLKEASMDIILPYLLDDKEISVSQELLDRLKKTLSPILSQR